MLAGVLTLAALPGSLFWGGIYTLSYVFGMVAPLFLISLFLDKVDFSQKLIKTFNKPIEYPIGGKKISITIAEAISGITFLVMGIIIVYLALANRLFVHSEYQTAINIYLTKFLNTISGFIKIIPEYVWALLLVIIIGEIIWRVIRQFNKEKHE